MNKKWIDERIKEEEQKAEEIYKKLEDLFIKQNFISNEYTDKMLNELKKRKKENRYVTEYLIKDPDIFFHADEDDVCFVIENYEAYSKWLEDNNILDLAYSYSNKENWVRYADSEVLEVDGDIIITDPCYIMRAEHHGTTPITEDDWSACDYGSNMEALGIKHYLTRSTIYGDWSCTTFDATNGMGLKIRKAIGDFCADAGLVSVFLLDEVLKYNPDFDYHKNRDWTTTWIKDFKGKVQIVCKVSDKTRPYDTASVIVKGSGIIKSTGEKFKFETRQTGL